MPQEPKKRHSRQRQGKRRASIKLHVPKATQCLNCKALILSHTVCKQCGYYNGRQVLVFKQKEKEQVKNKPA